MEGNKHLVGTGLLTRVKDILKFRKYKQKIGKQSQTACSTIEIAE